MAVRLVCSLPRVAVVRKLTHSVPSLACTTLVRSCLLSVVQFNSSTPRVCRFPIELSRRACVCVCQLSTDVPTTNICGDSEKKQQGTVHVPEPPTTCCMSGCANCVWLAYAQELLEIYKNSDQVTQEVLQAVQDPSIKAFLSIELADALQNIDKK